MILARRSFLTGLGALLAAPAIVFISNIMPVKAMPLARPDMEALLAARVASAEKMMAEHLNRLIFGNHDIPEYGEMRHRPMIGSVILPSEPLDSEAVYMRVSLPDRWASAA